MKPVRGSGANQSKGHVHIHSPAPELLAVLFGVMASSMLRALDSKRGRTSPTGLTPKQPSKRSSRLVTGERKKLQFSGNPSSSVWANEEERCLVRYIVNKGFTDSWPTTKRSQFWIEAANFLSKDGHTSRTSESLGGISALRERERDQRKGGEKRKGKEREREGGDRRSEMVHSGNCKQVFFLSCVHATKFHQQCPIQYLQVEVAVPVYFCDCLRSSLPPL